MKSRAILFRAATAAAVACGARSALAQYQAPDPAWNPPANYYNAATGTGFVLRTNLHNIITTGFVGHNYGDSRYAMGTGDVLTNGTVVAGGYENIDPNNSANIILYYNDASINGQWDNGATWNREHVWPKSLLNLTSSQVDNGYTGVASDSFELQPANPNINSSRSNNGYGYYVDNNTPGATYGNNTVNLNGTNTTFWNPGAADRGDAARGIFYMATRWLDPTNASRGTDRNNLELKNGAPTLYNFGDLNSLLHWNYTDGVSNFERRRNQYIYSSTLNPLYYQGNRNPFVDHPEYVWAIWGPTANNSQIYVGASANPDGSSASNVSVGRVMKNGTFGTTSATVTKTGSTPTTYDITASGVSTTAAGAGQPFDYDNQGRSITLGLTASTSTTGLKTGTVTIDNTDLTTAAAGQGLADGNDVVNVSGQVVDNRLITASSVAFQRVIVGAVVTSDATLSSPGDDDHNTRVTVKADASPADSNGVSITAGINQTYNGTFTSGTRTLQANFATTGPKSGSRSFVLQGEGLAGEAVNPLSVSYSATAVDHAQPSLASGSSVASMTLDFGYVQAGFPARSISFDVFNNPSSSGATLTAGLDVDGVSGGNATMSTNVVASAPASPLAAGTTPWTYSATFSPSGAAGDATTAHTIAVSDENIPGNAARPSLTLTTTGRVFTDASFPVSGFLELLNGQTLNTGPMAIAADVALEKRGAGVLNIDGTQTHGASSSLQVSGGTVNMSTDAGAVGSANLAVEVDTGATGNFAHTQHLRGLTIAGGQVTAAAGNDKVIVADALSVTGGGTLDLKDNKLIVHNGDLGSFYNSAYTGVTGLIGSGRNGGAWSGSGIVTTLTDAAAPSVLTSLAVARADDLDRVGSTFAGETLAAGDVMVMYTYGGDADLNGVINGDDYFRLDRSINLPGTAGWSDGDFNYDGSINGDDYFVIDSNVNNQSLGSFATSLGTGGLTIVPEPTSLAFIALATALLPRRRRRVISARPAPATTSRPTGR